MWLSLLAVAHASPVADFLEKYRALRGSSEAPEFEASVYDKALSGDRPTGVEWVEGVAAGKGWGVAVLAAPVESVWMALNMEETYPTRFDSPDASLVVSGSPHASGRRLFERLDLPVVTDRWWMVDTYHNAKLYQASAGRLWEQYWEDASRPDALGAAAPLAEGAMPAAWTRGAWLLLSLPDGRTLAEYFVWTDPGGSLPARAGSRFAASSVRNFIKDIEEFAVDLAGSSRTGFLRPDGTPL